MTRLVAFQNPNDLWCFSCDSDGIILQAFPPSMWKYIGSHIDKVRLIAASVLRYRVEEIDDNEYSASFEIVHNGQVVVKQSGLRMKYAEEYGEWNKETNSLDVHQIDDTWQALKSQAESLQKSLRRKLDQLGEIQDECKHPKLPVRQLTDEIEEYMDVCPDCGYISYCYSI